MHNFNKFIGIILLAFCFAQPAFSQPLSRLSIDIRGGMPIILSSASPKPGPVGGFGLRYSFNQLVSVSGDVNGGVIIGETKNGYFRNNIIQYGGSIVANPISLLNNRPKSLDRWNFLVSAGMGRMNLYYTLQTTSIDFRLNRNYFYYNFGLSARYYANEMVDFIGGATFNFTKTKGVDNEWDNRYDHFVMPYLGISIKILPYERKQPPEWSHVELPYNTGTMALTKKLISDLEQKMKDENQRNADSLASLRKYIQKVDGKVATVNTKVDTVDSKLNTVIDLLYKMNTQGVNINQTTTVTTPHEKGGKTPKNSTAKPTTKVTTTTTIAEPGKGVVDTVVTTTVIRNNSTDNQTKVKPQILDQSKVKESYAIVVGSFQVEDNAVKVRDKYKLRGWNAHILGSARSPYKRIVIFSNNYYEAAKIVTELRNGDSPDAWMLDIATGKGVFIK